MYINKYLILTNNTNQKTKNEEFIMRYHYADSECDAPLGTRNE